MIKIINSNPTYFSELGFYVPYIDQRLKFVSEHSSFDEWLWDKYTNKQVRPKSTDTVIDCGSFVGAFTVACFKHGVNHIHSVEPSSDSHLYIQKNIDHYGIPEDKVTRHQIGLGNVDSELTLNLSKMGVENSFLTPDHMATGHTEQVRVYKTKTFIEENNIDPDNLFIKVEAEGFEPEIIYGLKDITPRCIAVDVQPERNNTSPRKEINNFLTSKGYTLFQTKRCTLAIHHE